MVSGSFSYRPRSQGGRHRSVAAAEAVGRLVWDVWGDAYGVDIEHHHIDHPVLTSSTPA